MSHEAKIIDEMYAFVVKEDGSEGIPAISVDGMAMPLVGADTDRMVSLRPYAEHLAGQGLEVKLIRFTVREEVEVFVACLCAMLPTDVPAAMADEHHPMCPKARAQAPVMPPPTLMRKQAPVKIDLPGELT